MLKNMKIKKMLHLGFGGTLGIALIFVLTLSVLMGKQRAAYEDMVNQQVEANRIAINCRLDINIAARNTWQMILTKSSSNREHMATRINEVLEDMHSNLETLREIYPLEDNTVEEYISVIQDWEKKSDEVLSLIKQGKLQKAADEIDEMTTYLEKVISVGTTLSSSLTESRNDVLEKVQKNSTIAFIVVMVIMLIALIISIDFIRKLVRSIIEPTEEVREALIGFSEGNLSIPVEYEGNNEIGDMCNALRSSQITLKEVIADQCYLLEEMAHGNFGIKTQKEASYVGQLTEVLESINTINQKLKETLTQINQSSEQVNSGSEQVASGAQALAQGATEQSSAVQELAATIGEISNHINSTSDNAQQAKNQAVETGEVVELCNRQMQEMKAAMDEINQKSNDIGKIIKTIEDIAFQTNILALNAAVEAARAGAAGKGFAVVADEVRNLAGKSAEASKNTATLITGSITAVENGLQLVNETAESLEQVVHNTEATSEMIEKIAKASNEQAIAIVQVNQGVDQISSVVQTNSATAEESAAASEELSGQAAILERLVSQFRLGDE